MKDVLLAVPNISEGRDESKIAFVAGTLLLLDVHSDPDHNRSVLTYGGEPDAVLDASLAMIQRAVSVLDLRAHVGVHPRFGVVDVLPFVAYDTDEELVSTKIGDLIWRIDQGPGVPVVTYGRLSSDARPLPVLRRALREELPIPHPTAGITSVGLRDVLVAFNVNCVGPLRSARLAARELRAIPGIRALGLELVSRGEVQLSMNLVEVDRTGPARAFEAASGIASRHALRVTDAEIVGLVPERLRDQFRDVPLRWPVRTIEERLHLGTI